jgi:polysaccharide deacetylase family protein (PEP-CTERM system associated)
MASRLRSFSDASWNRPVDFEVLESTRRIVLLGSNSSDRHRMLTHAFTLDVEDYFHVSGFADRIPRTTWDQYPSRVVASTHRVLQLCERHSVRGTCFVLGWVARRHPQLVRDIAAAGHEVGCHSEWHRLVYDLSPDDFRRDLVASRDILEQILGYPVTSYRAPSFSITRWSTWALSILAEEGFTVDASIFPVRHDRYGMPGSPTTPYAVVTPHGPIREFPGSTVPVAGRTLPVGGGGYLRLYPAAVTERLLARIEQSGRPFMVYVHPWEFDPDQPRLSGSWKSTFRHYVGLRSTEHKLDRLMQQFRFDTMTAALDAWEQQNGPLPALPFDQPQHSSAALAAAR